MQKILRSLIFTILQKSKELMFHVKCYWIIRNMVIIYLIILNAILKTVSFDQIATFPNDL